MVFLILITMLALSCWSMLATVSQLRRNRAGKTWWVMFVVLTVVGLTAGWWLTFHFEYQASPRMRFHGFPLPLAFFHFEYGEWVDFISPPQIIYPGVVANMAVIVAAAMLPLLVALIMRDRGNRAIQDKKAGPED